MDFQTARQKMVDSQIRPDDVTDERLIEAFLTIPREAFVSKSKEALAYSELDIEVREGRTLWQARDLSKMLQALSVKEEDLVLVVAAAEGYAATLLEHMADTVIALEADAEWSEEAGEHVSGLGHNRVAYVNGPLNKGFPSEGPYDVIFVNGRVEVVPDAWLEQLKPGGRLGVVVGTDHNAHARIYTASETSVSYRNVFETSPPLLDGFKAEPAFEF